VCDYCSKKFISSWKCKRHRNTCYINELAKQQELQQQKLQTQQELQLEKQPSPSPLPPLHLLTEQTLQQQLLQQNNLILLLPSLHIAAIEADSSSSLPIAAQTPATHQLFGPIIVSGTNGDGFVFF